jgi:ubiquinone/menaquinone biosynthesis C-methylase UbiE
MQSLRNRYEVNYWRYNTCVSNVESFYDQYAQSEWERAERHPTEFAVTRLAMAEYLPPPPARVLDCGGGPGRYAIHLSGLGYRVTLFDLSAGNLALAREKAREAGTALEGYIHGSALDLSRFADSSFDIVLLLGPLYHLLAPAERRQALGEAARVLRPGGILMAGFITIFAPFRDAISKGYAGEYAAHPAETLAMLETQINRADDGGFTDAWFAHPDQVCPLMESAGLRTLALLAAEGLCAGHEQHIKALDPPAFDFWAGLNYRFSRDPALLGAADHLLYIGVR